MTNEATEQGTQTRNFEDEKLYEARSIIDGLCSYKGVFRQVPVEWYVVDRETPAVDYEKFIQVDPNQFDETMDREMTEVVVDEHFTGAEIETLKNYLEKNLETSIEVEEVKPFESPCLPIDFLGSDSTKEVVYLYTMDNYSLPFKVNGYADKRFGVLQAGHLSENTIDIINRIAKDRPLREDPALYQDIIAIATKEIGIDFSQRLLEFIEQRLPKNHVPDIGSHIAKAITDYRPPSFI